MATEWISRDDVVAAIEMDAVLAHYNIEPGMGATYRIHCPFHDDDRPSCSVNCESKVFNCFACGENGTVLDFIGLMEELDPETEFRAILETAISIIGHNPTPQRRSRKRGAVANNKASAKRGAGPPKKSKRSVTKSSADDAKDDAAASVTDVRDEQSEQRSKPLRAKRTTKKSLASASHHRQADGSLDLEPNAPLQAPAFPLKLQSRHPWCDDQLQRIGMSHSLAAEFGIGYEARSNALMAGRICFPIHNAAGELVAYAGRWASDETDGEGRFLSRNGKEQPRYRLPSNFHKQLELYNWHRVRASHGDACRSVVIVEGFWSVLRLWSLGLPVVALMGRSISEAQIRLLQEGGVRFVVVMLDGDDEGRLAATDCLPRLTSSFFTRSINLPDGIKPDDCDKQILIDLRRQLVAFDQNAAETDCKEATVIDNLRPTHPEETSSPETVSEGRKAKVGTALPTYGFATRAVGRLG